MVWALSGCSLGVDALGVDTMADEGPALAIAGPHDQLVYNVADDVDPDHDGIQLTVRVDVASPAIERVELGVREVGLSDVVAEDLAGRRAAFFDVTLAGTDTAITAAATLDDQNEDAQRVQVQAILRAVQ